uniref:GTPase Der n=1 Tax=Kalanchoe fedtschenkoi TaxID=63787 RepID=A0A7N0VI65_KALFE
MSQLSRLQSLNCGNNKFFVGFISNATLTLPITRRCASFKFSQLITSCLSHSPGLRPFGSFVTCVFTRTYLSLGLKQRHHTLFSSLNATLQYCTTAISFQGSGSLPDSESPGGNLLNIKAAKKLKNRGANRHLIDFTKLPIEMLPTVIIVGRPNVGKSALFNRLIRRREALVYNTPDDHVTRDIREGVAKLGDLRFRVLDSAGLEMAASSGSILDRTAGMTASVVARSQLALFLIDVREGLHPVDLEVGKWMRKHASAIKIILVMNKSESLDDGAGQLIAAAAETHKLGFGDPVAISAETGMGMADLYDILRPLLEEYLLKTKPVVDEDNEDNACDDSESSKLPVQLAIVGRPNVGKSTLLNTLLQEDRVLVGPEAGLTRDSVRAEFQFDGRTVYLVDTAGWLKTKQDKGPSSLSIMQSRKSIMRAHVIALVLDAEEIAHNTSAMNHAEVVIARRAVEEGRALIVVVNKMDLLRGKQMAELQKKVMEAVPKEIQTVLPQVTGIPVVFISAQEGSGREAVMHQVVDSYEKWCLRLSTARLNRWLLKVMSRHSWRNTSSQPKIKYFTQVKARPPTFVAFTSGKSQLPDTDIRFLVKSLKDDFDIGGIPIRIMQRSVSRNEVKPAVPFSGRSRPKMADGAISDKRSYPPTASVET